MKIILFCLQRKVGCPDVKLHLQLLLAQVFSIELCHKVKLFFIILLICSFHKKALQSTVYLITRLIKSILYTVDGEIKSFKECNYVCNSLQLPQDDYLLLFLSCSASELSFCDLTCSKLNHQQLFLQYQTDTYILQLTFHYYILFPVLSNKFSQSLHVPALREGILDRCLNRVSGPMMKASFPH